MADLTITPANIVPGSNANIKRAISAVAIGAGKSVYIDPVTKLAGLADNNTGTVADHNAVGVSVNASAVAGQPIDYISDGDLAFGAILTKGATYCVSGTAGGICPQADVVTGMELVILGVASSTSNLQVGVRDTNVVI